MGTILKNARLITPFQEIEKGFLLLEEGIIQDMGSDDDWVAAESIPQTEVKDLAGLTVLPGFIDLHVNGGAGADFLAGDLESFKKAAAFHLSQGTTAFLATLITSSYGRTIAGLEAARAYQEAGFSSLPQLLGVHLEGPYISRQKVGAHPLAHIRPPCLAEFLAFQEACAGAVKIITLAPELAGALEFIKEVKKLGIIPALGHTNATYEEARAGFDAGINYVTHMFNAMRPFHHRDPGAVGAVLDTGGLAVEVIADGYHLSPPAQRLLLRLKGAENLLLVTDAVSAAGTSSPQSQGFPLGDTTIQIKGGRAVNAEGNLAGSLLTLNKAVPNFVDFAGAPTIESVAMATANPARILGLAGKKGCLKVGADADLVVVDDDFQVKQVYISGKAAWPPQ